MRQLAICWHDVAQPLGSTVPVCRCPSLQLPSLATQAAAEADTSTSRRLQADLRAPTKELLLSCVAHLLLGLLSRGSAGCVGPHLVYLHQPLDRCLACA